MNLEEKISSLKIEYSVDENILEEYSYDKSIFKLKPKVVVFPKNVEEIKRLVNFAKENNLNLTCRSGGTDMSGGPLTNSILIVFTKYFNKILEINHKEKYAIVEPGVYFRDFEKEIDKYNLMLPSYPASKEICALGGMIANNSGGEKTLKYGKTQNYVIGLNVVLSDGNEYYFEKVSGEKLRLKLSQQNFEGEVYRKIYKLLKENYELVQKSKPKVSKNSSGYNVWDAYGRTRMDANDGTANGRELKTRMDANYINADGREYIRDDSRIDSRRFANKEWLDLTKIFVGSQGTLGIITSAKIKLVEKEKFSKLAVIFIKNLNQLPEFTNKILKLQPTSLEITDDHTFKIFLKFAKEMASLLGAKGIFSQFKMFLPEIFLILKIGLPKLIILAEFTSNNEKEIQAKIEQTKEIVKKYKFLVRIPKDEKETEKYWRLRRDTYKLLREKIKNLTASPFIDDFIIPPEKLPQFLPELYKILDNYKLIYTISGHLGDGNLHIIPLVNLKDEKQRKNILEITDKVYDLVLKFDGLLTAEHNDGLIRGPYLEKEFGKEIFSIFQEIKNIFDPENIFNPYKKITALKENIGKFMLR